jgi:hypothetical protein
MSLDRTTSRRAVCLLLLALLSGCSHLKAEPAEDAGFLESPERMATAEHINARWVSEEYVAGKAGYTRIVVRPVSIDYLKKTADWTHVEILSEEQIRKDARELADYMEAELKAAFRRGDARALTLTDSSGPGTLLVEIAIVELVPTDVVSNAAGHVAGHLVPGGSAVSAFAAGSIAVEVRIRDSETSEVLGMAKDRRVDKISAVNVAGLTPYRHAIENIDDWVEALVAWFNLPPEEEVEVAHPITLLAW